MGRVRRQNIAMGNNRLLIPCLLAASVAVDAVLLALTTDQYEWPALRVAALIGLAGGQINLASLWAMLGTKRLPWRMAALIVVPLAWSLALSVLTPRALSSYEFAGAWAVHFFTQTAILVSLLMLAKSFRGRLVHRAETGREGRRQLQFSLRYLFAWLTATALTLSLLKVVFEFSTLIESGFAQANRYGLEWDAVLILGFTIATLGLTVAWLVLDTRPWNARLLSAGITAMPTILVIGYVSTLLVGGVEFTVAIVVLWLTATGYSAVVWIVLRVAGYRIVWHGAGGVNLPEPAKA